MTAIIKKGLGRMLLVLFLAAVLAITLYPVAYALFGSLKTNMELVLGGSLLPKEWHFENYSYAFGKLHFYQYFINSVILCLLCTVLAIVVSSMAGFCMDRYEFPGKRFLNRLYLGLMFIALGSVTIYPTYKLLSAVGLTGNLLGLALVLTGGQAANVFLVRSFVHGVPRELDESAMLEGCGTFRLFFSIIFPLIRPIVAVVGLFAFRNAWNDYITSMVFTIGHTELQTLTSAVVALRYSPNAAAEWHIMAAGAAIALLPILVVYTIMNKQFISGLTAGAVKG